MRLSQCPILRSDPLCLRAAGAGITEIDLLAPRQRDVIDLFVSQNQITNLENIIQFNSLQRLLISFNRIRYIEDLFPLAKLASLRELNLEGNPVCQLPLFTIHVFYLIPALEVLNGRKVEFFSAFKISRDQLGLYVNSEANLLRLLAMADLLAECISARRRISSLGAMFRDRFPQQVFVEYCHQIRQKGQRLQIQKYFQYLNDLLLKRHRRLHNDAERQDDVDEAAVARHFQILTKLAQPEELAAQVPLFEELTQLGATFVQPKEKDRDRSKTRSRLSDRFSIASSVRSRSTIASPKTPPRPKQAVTEDPPPAPGEEPRTVQVEAVPEAVVTVVIEPPPPDVSVVLSPDFDFIAKSFGRWKLRARVGRGQINFIHDFTQISDRVAGARRSQHPPPQFPSLKEVSERRSLMQQVETGREVVGLSRGRYHQLKREVEVTKGPTSWEGRNGIFQ